MGRPDNGNRIDNRARGNAAQLHEKYRNLAREAQMQGDRVNTEYYLQFADHYFRVLSDQRGRNDEQQPRRPNDAYEDVFNGNLDAGDDEYGDEGEPIRAGEQSQPSARDDGRREGGQRDTNQRDTGQRDTGQRDGNRRDEQRDVQRDGGQRDGQQRETARRDDGYREGQREGGERPRHAEAERRPRADRPDRPDRPDRDATNGERRPRVEREPFERPRIERQPVEVATEATVTPPIEALVATPAEIVAEAPRRRGRPRRDAMVEQSVPVEAPVEPDAPAAFEPDRLPPSLGISAVASNDTDEPKPRRRRVRAAPPEASAAE